MKIKHKTNKIKLRFEGNTPRLDIKVKINHASIYEIENSVLVGRPTDSQFEAIKQAITEKISETIAKCFEKSKAFKADIWSAYEMGIKYHYDRVMENYPTMEDFLDSLKLNVKVQVDRLEY